MASWRAQSSHSRALADSYDDSRHPRWLPPPLAPCSSPLSLLPPLLLLEVLLRLGWQAVAADSQ